MNSSLLYSLIAHCLIGLLLFITIPSWKEENKTVNKSAVLWVDLTQVEVGLKTNLPPPKNEAKKTTQAKQETKKEIKRQEKAHEPPKPVEPVQKIIKQEDAVPVVEPKKEEKKKADPKTVKSKPVPVAKPKSVPKKPEKEKTPIKKPEKTEKKTDDDNLDSLLASVDKIDTSKAMQQAKEQAEMDNMLDGIADSYANTEEYDPNAKLSISQIDFIASAIRQNWSFDKGVKDIETMVVVLEMNLMPNGQLESVDVKSDKARRKTDGAYNAIAESAIRAIQMCDKQENSPFKQLATKYPADFRQWQKITLTFNPVSGDIKTEE